MNSVDAWLLLITVAVVVSSVVACDESTSGGLGAWWMPSASWSSPCTEPSSSSSPSPCGWTSRGAVVPLSPCSCRRLSRLLRSFLSFCRALHSRSSSSSFPCSALNSLQRLSSLLRARMALLCSPCRWIFSFTIWDCFFCRAFRRFCMQRLSSS
ncbi:hypothetical protein INR49_017064 [Caranx melampygus]|nr:hypothetical protein INR49_017064 [Caranx melampygus]